MSIFEEMESSVRTYCREFPAVFHKAKGAYVYDAQGNKYLDFLCGAGALGYGHNPPEIIEPVIRYLEEEGILTSLDLHTLAKQKFLERLRDVILLPRGMDYVVQFTGPTGTNAVEAALKLARNVTRRTNVIAFTNGFHGASLGALSATGNSHLRSASGLALTGVTRFPYDGYSDSAGPALLDEMLADPSSGIDPPAAFLLETIQGEGGLRAASSHWLRQIQAIAARHGAWLIVDDIQAGCGRTGTFFSFEQQGLDPDIICLSKSISAVGLPMSLVLIRRSLDEWQPGQHNGTFRGNNLAFVAARAALERYWDDSAFVKGLSARAATLDEALRKLAGRHTGLCREVRGRGFMRGLVFERAQEASAVSRESFERGLIVETCGPRGEVVKLLPPITLEDSGLDLGIATLHAAMNAVEQGGVRGREPALAVGQD
jgi:diaminobutyrate-2-oxoglutarate transaminase